MFYMYLAIENTSLSLLVGTTIADCLATVNTGYDQKDMEIELDIMVLNWVPMGKDR